TDWIELKRIGHLQTLTAKPLGFERFKCFYAYQMTAPGIPVIYYGDEMGMPGGNDPGNRSPMKFEGLNTNENSLREWVKQLTGLRKNSLALMYGDFDILHYTENAIVIRRSYLGETVVVMINKGDLNFLWNGQNAFESYGKLKQSLSSRDSDIQRFEVGPNSALVLQFIQE
ncbi:alpha-amylase family glycosyl hydrolase, partial [Bacteroidia bacterium]|nr:alpha-amylase family glycosyl hydrolase [Bacteroidia bacterium]